LETCDDNTSKQALSSPVVNNDLRIISRLWGDLVDDEENEECSIQSDQHVSDRLEGFQVVVLKSSRKK